MPAASAAGVKPVNKPPTQRVLLIHAQAAAVLQLARPEPPGPAIDREREELDIPAN